jgi:integrase
MGVRKRYNKWWVDFSFGGIRYRKVSPENSKKGAEAYEIVLKQRLAREEPIDGIKNEAVTFSEYAANWFETYVKNNNKHSEITHKETILRVHLNPFFGRMKLDKINNLDIERYKAKKIKENLNPKTVNNHLTVLHKSFQCAVEWGLIQNCPVMKKLKTPPSKFDYLTLDECELLSTHANGIWRDMIKVALGTGLRFGELIALTWDDINFGQRELTVRQAFAEGVLGSPKSNKIRSLPMSDSVYEIFDEMKGRTGFVFSNANGEPLKQYICVRRLHAVCRKAGLRKIGWHVLRHTFASHLAQAGANLVAIQNLLGHSDIHTTMRYAHINRNVLREAIDSLGNRNNIEQKISVIMPSQVVTSQSTQQSFKS